VPSATLPNKTEVITAYRRDDKDTGSPEVQIALLTERIKHLTTRVVGACSAWSDSADGCSPTCTAEARSDTRKSSGDSVCDGETARVSGKPRTSWVFS
jgi:hypothetical protein